MVADEVEVEGRRRFEARREGAVEVEEAGARSAAVVVVGAAALEATGWVHGVSAPYDGAGEEREGGRGRTSR